MEPLESLADTLLFEWQNRRLRLWLTNLRDCPDEFGHWAGLVRLRAEHLSDQWRPHRTELVERLRTHFGESIPDAMAHDQVLLPMAADALEADLVAKGVPKPLAERARDLFTLEPPTAQWRL
ncbi:MAG TPA: hypothetical protein VLJ39_17650 [Tepidisphaeraceae bacterium]|jgi:hypothetical protein|nr:hypothetical protein [Tepidisphaeraceae bacterium]